MSSDFQTTTYGKWILAGEHAVLRGNPALVFPIKSRQLKLTYSKSDSELHADFAGEHGSDMHLLFWSVLEQGAHILGHSLNAIKGNFHIENEIPIGVGMGASAALCVAMARWFAHDNKINLADVHYFARELEHLFHGQSSGLDITGVAAETGVYFKQGFFTAIKQAWHPVWRLSSCGQIGMTSHCITQVKNLWRENIAEAEALDRQMADSVQDALNALESNCNAKHQLAQAITQAGECFHRWGLVSESLRAHMQLLQDAGALAVKPTGSGGGGYVISLWEKTPPVIENIVFEEI